MFKRIICGLFPTLVIGEKEKIDYKQVQQICTKAFKLIILFEHCGTTILWRYIKVYRTQASLTNVYSNAVINSFNRHLAALSMFKPSNVFSTDVVPSPSRCIVLEAVSFSRTRNKSHWVPQQLIFNSYLGA